MLRYLAATAVSSVLFAAPILVAPVDESGRDPRLAETVAGVRAACADRDAAAVEKALAEDVVASFGEDAGVRAFVAFYELKRADAPFWEACVSALDLGGAFINPDMYEAPYVGANLPESADPYLSVVAIGPRTLLYAEPRDDAPTLADVTHQLLTSQDIDDPEASQRAPEGWLPAISGEGARGFVRAAETRSPLDHRAVFQKIGARWLLVSFVAGD